MDDGVIFLTVMDPRLQFCIYICSNYHIQLFSMFTTICKRVGHTLA
jgi:hypothetical protein